MKRILLRIFCCIVLIQGILAQDISETEKGIELYRAGKFNEAVSLLEKESRSKKPFYSAKIYLAAAYVHIGKESAATKLLQKAGSNKNGEEKLDQQVKIIKKFTSVCDLAYLDSFGTASTKVAIEFLSNGKIGFVFPFYTTSPGHAAAVSEAAKKTVFEPAVLSGKPVTSVKVFLYECRLS